ncbi:MAG: flagellar hook-basal body complex protein FliE [Actinomycetota bacterium]|nr:flagellar hook-basal body complex protein FliE [Actinomycetota bacterium]
MSVSPVEATGFMPYVAPVVPIGTPALGEGTAGVAAASGEFGNLLTDGLDRLQSVQSASDNLAVKAATGDLTAIHQYTIAATEASVTTQLTVAMRNKALDAFNEILKLPVG